MNEEVKIGKTLGVQDQDKNVEKQNNKNVYKDENEQHSEYIHKSVKETLKTTRIMIIAGWLLLPIGLLASIMMGEPAFILTLSGIALPIFSSTIVGIQFVRKQNVIKGLCVSYIGMLTFGIWPLIVASKEIKKEEVEYFDSTSKEFKKQLLQGYEIAKPVLIIGIITLIILLGFHTIIIASLIIGICDIRQDKLTHGILISMFGVFTLGIWPLIYTSKQRALLNLNIKHNI